MTASISALPLGMSRLPSTDGDHLQSNVLQPSHARKPDVDTDGQITGGPPIRWPTSSRTRSQTYANSQGIERSVHLHVPKRERQAGRAGPDVRDLGDNRNGLRPIGERMFPGRSLLLRWEPFQTDDHRDRQTGPTRQPQFTADLARMTARQSFSYLRRRSDFAHMTGAPGLIAELYTALGRADTMLLNGTEPDSGILPTEYAEAPRTDRQQHRVSMRFRTLSRPEVLARSARCAAYLYPSVGCVPGTAEALRSRMAHLAKSTNDLLMPAADAETAVFFSSLHGVFSWSAKPRSEKIPLPCAAVPTYGHKS